jgi:hypothetical protein
MLKAYVEDRTLYHHEQACQLNDNKPSTIDQRYKVTAVHILRWMHNKQKRAKQIPDTHVFVFMR